MTHLIHDEQKIYAYRKLIDLLQEQSVKFYNNYLTDLKLLSDLGIYENNSIFILFGIMRYIFSDITLYDGEMKYEYTEPFEVLKKAVEITNKSSKLDTNLEMSENIFEPLKNTEKSTQFEIMETVRHEIRKGRDSNPRSPEGCLVSSEVLSTTQPPFRNYFALILNSKGLFYHSPQSGTNVG